MTWVCVTGAVVVDCGPGEACAEFGPTATPLPTSLPEPTGPAMSRKLRDNSRPNRLRRRFWRRGLRAGLGPEGGGSPRPA